MPGPGLRSAGGTIDNGHKGPTVVPCGRPSMPRTPTVMTWPESLESSSSEEELPKDLPKQVAKQLPKGWSNISNRITSSFDFTLTGPRSTGPRMKERKMPPLLRSMTGSSWISGVSSGGSSKYPSSGSHANTEASPSSPSKASSGNPRLKKGSSYISLRSLTSGVSHVPTEGSHRSRKSFKEKRTRDLDSLEKELEQNGERNIVFKDERVVVYPQALNDKNRSQPNKIRTARFTLLTWLPKSLFNQFQRIANIYFLMICLLVNFQFSPKDWKSKVFPFMGVLIWTALKDLHEDRQRRRDDAIENYQKCLLFDSPTKSFKLWSWQDVFVGDLLLVRSDEVFAADMILLYTGGGVGAEAFISTASLDGEMNLKERRCPSMCDTITAPVAQSASGKDQHSSTLEFDAKETEEEAVRVLSAMHAKCLQARMGKPEVAVTDVKGSLSFDDDQCDECPVAWVNYLPRGCTLRNTSWVLGVVIYIGEETKTRLNTAQSQTKVSNMQVYLNYCVWGLLAALIIVCLYSATLSSLKADEFSFCCNDESWLIRLGIFLITFYHVVPMSLYVVFEMLKLMLGWQVNADKQMICPETDEPAMARTADLIEEMGQISFVFSDKTGTLTRNEMVFARCCVGGLDPGDFRISECEREGDAPPGVKKICRILGGSDGVPDALLADVQWFFKCLAVCHSVQVKSMADPATQTISAPAADDVPPTLLSATVSRQDVEHHRKSKRIKSMKEGKASPDCQEYCYLGVSPDEVALVQAAHDVGIVFTLRTRSKRAGASHTSSQVVLRTGANAEDTISFSILFELEFNSDRKRMSVVCEHEGEYYCITKGADSIMESLTTEKFSAEYTECLQRFSQQGLRTLVIAMKKIDPQYFKVWQAKYTRALASLDKTKDLKVSQIAAEMEQQLNIVGISAVEDRLQDGVAEAIETLKLASVRVWVLTGDKTETAVDIAKSCLLFNNETQLAYAVDAESKESAFAKLQGAKSILRFLETGKDGGLVLDGKTIQHAFMDETCKELIYELGLASRSCVCCRLTPLQKRQLVELVHKRSPSTITLAIGDGANDVPMIEGAHLGIAVRGKEGCQAVQVSDVAISQFRFLVPLLLCHGRRAYRRIAVFLCYYLYKNVALAIGDVVWMHQDFYRGRIAFPEYLSVNYNFLFTSWHILFVLGMDEDVPDEVAVGTPALYLVGPSRALFNWKVFTSWMIIAVYHGVVAWIIPNLWFGKDLYNKKQPGPFWVGSCASFTIIVIIALIKLLMSAVGPLKFRTSILPTLTALLMYVFVLVILGYTSIGISLQPNMEGIPGDVLQSKDALISIFAIPPACMTVDITSKLLCTCLWPTPLDRIKKPCFKF